MFLLFDIGGTKMRLALSRDGKNIEKPRILKTPKKFKDGIDVFVNNALEMTGKKKIKGIAGGIAGILDKNKTKLFFSPNLPLWTNKPLQEVLQKRLKASVKIENDTALAGLGEALVGAGKDKKIVAYITVSTGVGGARIVGGEIDKSTFGFEPGHHIINFEGGKCLGCGVSGDLESYISGRALEKKCHLDTCNINDKRVWGEVNKMLAFGLHNVTAFWSPEVIVLGGGMMKSNKIDINIIRKQLKQTLKIFPALPLIKKAKLGDLGGLKGALYLIK